MKKGFKFALTLATSLTLFTVVEPALNITQSTTAYAKVKKSGKYSFNSKKYGTFKTNKATIKITNVKVMPSAEEGKKVVVFECDITNNSKKEVDLVNDVSMYEFIHAYQKTSTSSKNLEPGMVGLDENADSLEKDRDDVMTNDSVLPGKTVQGDFVFTLVNDKPVKLKFDNKNYETFATKSYKVTPHVTE